MSPAPPDRPRTALRLRAALPVAALLLTAAAASAQGSQRFTVVVDAAHGGPDPGTQLTSQLAEKSLTLDLSVLLRSALAARGMQVVTTREGDTDPSADDRAGIANHAAAQACLVLHATASGSGVHLYTSSLTPAPAADGLVPWDTAAAPWVIRSLKLSSDLSNALQSAGLPYTLGRVQLAPLDSMQCPTVAVEVAPLKDHVDSLAGEAYRRQIVDALAAALVSWRAEVQNGATP